MPDQKEIGARLAALEREARQKAGLDRSKMVAQPPVRDRADAPLRAAAAGEPLAIGQDETGAVGWFLEGRALRVGDVIEVYTNAANGWIRGKLAWTGVAGAPARISINVWDANGARDEDGLPPWIGELDSAIPKAARCRLPDAR